MVGRDLVTNRRDARTECRGEIVLEVDRLTCPDRFEDVSFRLRRGEVLGLAGLIGAGRTEVASALIGLVHGVQGEMRLEGRAFRPRHPAEALAAGVAMVTEDRQDSGLIGTMSVKGNLTLSALDQYCHVGWIDDRLEAKAAESWVRDLSIRSAGLNQEIGALSGGNQQKVLLARALMTRPTILILDEPTRGIDVGAKAEIYDWILRLGEQGMAILLVSSELTELLLLCDRTLILCEGRVTGELAADEATEEGILALAMPRAAG
jgi:ABC-type sugar transport system ATPase subunit